MMLSIHSISWLLIWIGISVVKGNFDCPKFCTCQSTNIDCDGKDIELAKLETVFSSLPKETEAFTVQNSKLKDLQTRFFSRVLPNLKILKLESNLLENVPQNLSGVFPALQSLFLQSNQIQSISGKDFAGLKKLQKLRLDKNQLTTIGPNLFQGASMLTELYLESNNINELSPDGFSGLQKLTNLVLENNKIKALPSGLFEDFPDNVLQVNLKNNEITNLPNGLFRAGQTVAVLDLTSNMITKIADDAFKDITINGLVLNNNKIAELKPQVLSGLKNSPVINALGNPIDCNCNVAKILKAYNPQHIFATCATPADMKDTQLSQIPLEGIEDKLKCTICDLNNTCINNGQCVVISKTEMRCECPPTYEGMNCENEITTTTTPTQKTVTTPIKTTTTSTTTIKTTAATLTPEATNITVTAGKAPPIRSPEKKDNTTLYIIIAVVALIILIILAIVIYCCCMRKKKEKSVEESHMMEDGKATNV